MFSVFAENKMSDHSLTALDLLFSNTWFYTMVLDSWFGLNEVVGNLSGFISCEFLDVCRRFWQLL